MTSDHDLLIRIDERVEQIIEDNINFKKDMKTYDNRLNRIEGWRNKIIGISISCPILIPLLIAVILR